jgi:hypothetical protein
MYGFGKNTIVGARAEIPLFVIEICDDRTPLLSPDTLNCSKNAREVKAKPDIGQYGFFPIFSGILIEKNYLLFADNNA